MEWRERALNRHPYQTVVTRRWILPNNAITTLSKLRDVDVRGPETIAEVVDGSEEWTLFYAAEIYNIITQFDEKRYVRKLCARLSSGVAKKVRSVAWQRRIRKRYEKNAELALITAENARDDITKFEKAARKEKRKLLARHKTTAGEMAELKRGADVHRSKLCRTLEGAVQDLNRHCELLREVVVWSGNLAEVDNNEDMSEGRDEEGGSGTVGRTTIYLPPPARRSSRQSM